MMTPKYRYSHSVNRYSKRGKPTDLLISKTLERDPKIMAATPNKQVLNIKEYLRAKAKIDAGIPMEYLTRKQGKAYTMVRCSKDELISEMVRLNELLVLEKGTLQKVSVTPEPRGWFNLKCPLCGGGVIKNEYEYGNKLPHVIGSNHIIQYLCRTCPYEYVKSDPYYCGMI